MLILGPPVKALEVLEVKDIAELGSTSVCFGVLHHNAWKVLLKTSRNQICAERLFLSSRPHFHHVKHFTACLITAFVKTLSETSGA